MAEGRSTPASSRIVGARSGAVVKACLWPGVSPGACTIRGTLVSSWYRGDQPTVRSQDSGNQDGTVVPSVTVAEVEAMVREEEDDRVIPQPQHIELGQ